MENCLLVNALIIPHFFLFLEVCCHIKKLKIILLISLKKLCPVFGRAGQYVNYGIIELLIIVTFPYNVRFLLLQA
jgi:hypothetical protein